MEIVENVFGLFVGQVDLVVVEDLLQVRLFGLGHHLFILSNFALPLFLVHGQVVGSVSTSLEADKISQHHGHVYLVFVLVLAQCSLELCQML